MSVFSNARARRQGRRAELPDLAALEALLTEYAATIPRPQDKRDGPLMSRGEYADPGQARGAPGPLYIPTVDADHPLVSLKGAHERLELAGEPHVVAASHTEGRFRVYGARLCRNQAELEVETRRLARLAGLGAEPGQWDASCLEPKRHFFTPTGAALVLALPGPWEQAPEVAPGQEIADPDGSRPRGRPKHAPDRDDVEEALAWVCADERPIWLDVGMALHSERDRVEWAREVWDEWSATSNAFDAPDQDRVWESFSDRGPGDGRGRGLTIRKVFWLARGAGSLGVGFGYPGVKSDLPALTQEQAREELTTATATATGQAIAVVAKADRNFDLDKSGAVRRTMANALVAVGELDLGLVYDELSDRILMLGAGFAELERRFPKIGRSVNDFHVEAVAHLLDRPRTGVAEFPPELILRAMKRHAMSRRFNPVEVWLRGLEWDGIERLGSWGERLMGAPPGPYTSAVCRLMLVGAVARAFVPGVKHDCLPVLESPEQGVGKTSTVKILGGEYTLEGLGTGDLHSRDVVATLIGKWFVELDEMEVARKADVQALKGFLSKTEDRARLAYERTARDFPRRCVFVGTTNEEEYLKDDTGNRRFWPLRVGLERPIDLEGLQAERDQLFAEAVRVWLADPRPQALVLPRELWGKAAEEQGARLQTDGWEAELAGYLEGLEQDPDRPRPVRVTMRELMLGALDLEIAHVGQREPRRIAGILKRLGWVRATRWVGGKAAKVWEPAGSFVPKSPFRSVDDRERAAFLLR
ncbi:MAG: PriCT-2 domain-containing protein [Candidatus Rokubacteria bacterium]|nr:PriCT-2 domain-containing protein [Candidatus Rokubacteria bacterium]